MKKLTYKLLYRRSVLRLYLTLCLLTFLPLHSIAQEVTNIDWNASGGLSKITITYDLDVLSEVSISVSLDGGRNWIGPLQKVTGDVGNNIQNGNKTIVWNLLEEPGFEDIMGEFKDVRFGIKPVKIIILTPKQQQQALHNSVVSKNPEALKAYKKFKSTQIAGLTLALIGLATAAVGIVPYNYYEVYSWDNLANDWKRTNTVKYYGNTNVALFTVGSAVLVSGVVLLCLAPKFKKTYTAYLGKHKTAFHFTPSPVVSPQFSGVNLNVKF